jgi:hypothetical protein
LRAWAISTGKRGFLTIGGRSYKLDKDVLDLLRSALGAGAGGMATLGLDPQGWVKDPQADGSATIGGVDTDRVSGTIDVAALLDDVAKLLAGGGFEGLLTPQLRTQIEGAVTATKVDVWSGAQDRILRQLAVVVGFAFKQGTSPVTGLDGGKISLRVRLDGVNATTVDPVAPKHARPLSELLSRDDIGAMLPGLIVSKP